MKQDDLNALRDMDPFGPPRSDPIQARIRNVLLELRKLPGLNPEDFYGRELRVFLLHPPCEFYNREQAVEFGNKLAKLTGGRVRIDSRTLYQDCKHCVEITLASDVNYGTFGRFEAWKLERSLHRIRSNMKAIHALMTEYGATLPPLTETGRSLG